MKETLEEAAERIYPNAGYDDEMWCDSGELFREKFIEGAKWMQERMYSAEDMRKAYDQGIDDSFDIGFSNKDDTNFNKWFEQFKKK